MKYSITLASFRKLEPLGDTLDFLAEAGYDAVEMFGEPGATEFKKCRQALSTSSLPVCGITGMWGRASRHGWNRRLLSRDPAIVKSAQRYVQECIRMCNMFGGEEMNVCLFADDNSGFDPTHGAPDPAAKARLAAKAAPLLNRLCKEARNHGVRLVLEPLNRYSTPYCSTVSDALAAAKQVEGLGVLLDTFHMNIEEDSFEGAIRQCQSVLYHTHLADNNRKMPGCAHIDFAKIIGSLRSIGYDRFVSCEPTLIGNDYRDQVIRGLQYLKSLERNPRQDRLRAEH